METRHVLAVAAYPAGHVPLLAIVKIGRKGCFFCLSIHEEDIDYERSIGALKAFSSMLMEKQEVYPSSIKLPNTSTMLTIWISDSDMSIAKYRHELAARCMSYTSSARSGKNRCSCRVVFIFGSGSIGGSHTKQPIISIGSTGMIHASLQILEGLEAGLRIVGLVVSGEYPEP